jgi:hypothetical protein
MPRDQYVLECWSPGGPVSVAKRKSYYGSAARRRESFFETDIVYTFHIFQHLVDLGSYELDLSLYKCVLHYDTSHISQHADIERCVTIKSLPLYTSACCCMTRQIVNADYHILTHLCAIYHYLSLFICMLSIAKSIVSNQSAGFRVRVHNIEFQLNTCNRIFYCNRLFVRC